MLQVPQRTTSISPALVRKNSPGNGPGGLGPRTGAHLIRARYIPLFMNFYLYFKLLLHILLQIKLALLNTVFCK